MKIGWENVRGGYYIKKLLSDVEKLSTNIGNLTTLTTTHKNNLVNAINDVENKAGTASGKVGTLSNLTTENKTNAVSAINEVDSHADTNASAIGTLSNLTTSNKTDLVSAINTLNLIKHHGYVEGISGGTAHMDLTLSRGYRGIIITDGAAAGRMGIWIVASSSGGGLANSVVKAGTSVSLSGSQDVLSVNFSETQYSVDVYSIDLEGSAEVVTT